MTIGEMLLPEFDRETASTRKILERVPEDKFAWKPHQKSSTLGKLASHLAAIPGWAAVVVNGHGKKSPDAASKAELLEVLDRNIAAGREALATANDDYLSQNIRVGADLSKPRAAILRGGAYYLPRGSIWYFPQTYRLDEHQKFLLMSPGRDRAGTIGFRCVVDAP